MTDARGMCPVHAPGHAAAAANLDLHDSLVFQDGCWWVFLLAYGDNRGTLVVHSRSDIRDARVNEIDVAAHLAATMVESLARFRFWRSFDAWLDGGDPDHPPALPTGMAFGRVDRARLANHGIKAPAPKCRKPTPPLRRWMHDRGVLIPSR